MSPQFGSLWFHSHDLKLDINPFNLIYKHQQHTMDYIVFVVFFINQAWYTLRFRYNAVNFVPNPHKSHPSAPVRVGYGIQLWFESLTYILPQWTQRCMKYNVIFGCVITALDGIERFIQSSRHYVNRIWQCSTLGIKIILWTYNGMKARYSTIYARNVWVYYCQPYQTGRPTVFQI